jgi:ketosteroid isomerase-like protein
MLPLDKRLDLCVVNLTENKSMLTAQKILTKAYEAFNARDIDTALTYLHPDVDWQNGMEGGRVHGQQGMREYWTRQWGLIDSRVESTAFHAEEDGRILVDVHQAVRDLAGNILMDTMVQHVYLMQERLVTRMDIREP